MLATSLKAPYHVAFPGSAPWTFVSFCHATSISNLVAEMRLYPYNITNLIVCLSRTFSGFVDFDLEHIQVIAVNHILLQSSRFPKYFFDKTCPWILKKCRPHRQGSGTVFTKELSCRAVLLSPSVTRALSRRAEQ